MQLGNQKDGFDLLGTAPGTEQKQVKSGYDLLGEQSIKPTTESTQPYIPTPAEIEAGAKTLQISIDALNKKFAEFQKWNESKLDTPENIEERGIRSKALLDEEDALNERINTFNERRLAQASGVMSAGKPEQHGMLRNTIDKVAGWLGLGQELEAARADSIERMKAEAVVERAAATYQNPDGSIGMPLGRYKNSPEMLEQFVGEFGNMMTWGIAPAMREAVLGETQQEPTTSAGYIGKSLGSLTGLIMGPARSVGGGLFGYSEGTGVLGRVLKYAPGAVQEMKLSHRVIVEGLRDAATLGTAMGLSALGDAANQVTFSQAAGTIYERVKSGAMTGAIFGSVKGIFPREGWEKAARMFSGLVMLNIQRRIESGGTNAYLDRPVGEVLFDTLMDTYFLWKGLPEKSFGEIADKAKVLVDKSVDLNNKEKILSQVPESDAKKVQEQLLEAEKKQQQMETQRLAEKAAAELKATEETKKKLEDLQKAKVKKPKETAEERKVRMAALRAKKKPKAAKTVEPAAEAGTVATGVQTTPEQLASIGVEPAQVPATPDVKVAVETEQPVPSKIEQTPETDEEASPIARTKELVASGKNTVKDIQDALGVSQSAAENLLELAGARKAKPAAAPAPKPAPKIKSGEDLLAEAKAKANTGTQSFFPDKFAETSGEVFGKFGVVNAEEGEIPPGVDLLPVVDAGGLTTDQATLLAKQNGVAMFDGTTIYFPDGRTETDFTNLNFEHGYEAVVKYPNVEAAKRGVYKEGQLYSPDPALMEELGGYKEDIRLTNVDTQTGSPDSPAIVDTNESVFRFDKTTVAERTKAYDQNVAVAKDMKDLLTKQANAKDPGVTAWKLVNDVNRWLNGEDINIAGVRDFLSELAGKADSFKGLFYGPGDEEGFQEWKELVSDAAKWARNADRSKIGQTLYSGIPVDRIVESIKELFRDINRNTEGLSTRERILVGRLNDLEESAKLLATGNVEKSSEDLKRQFADIPTGSELENLKNNSSPLASSLLDKVDSARTMLNDSLNALMDKNKGGFTLYSGIDPIAAIKNIKDIFKKYYNNELSDKDAAQFRGLIESQAKSGKPVLGMYNTKLDKLNANIPLIKDQLSVKAMEEVERLYQEQSKFLNSRTDYGSDSYRKDLEGFRRRFQNILERDGFDGFQYYNSAEGDPGYLSYAIFSPTQFKSIYNVGTYKEAASGGNMFYSGIPVDKITATIKEIFGRKTVDEQVEQPEGIAAAIQGAQTFSGYMDKTRGMKSLKTAGELRGSVVRAGIDRVGNLRRELISQLGDSGYRVLQTMYLAQGGHPLATNMFHQMKAEVDDGLSSEEKVIKDGVILARRIKGIYDYKTKKQFTVPKEVSLENSILYDALYRYKSVNGIRDLTDAEAARISDAANKYYDWMKKPLGDLRDEGLISQEEYDKLIKHNYRKIGKVNEVFDRSFEVTVGGKKRTVYDSGIESIQHGKETDLFEPSSDLMALEVFNRSYGRIVNNRANKELLRVAQENPENPFVRVTTPKEKVNELVDDLKRTLEAQGTDKELVREKVRALRQSKKVPVGWKRFFVYEGGERKSIFLSPDTAKEWNTSSPEVSYRFARLMRFMSGAPIVRTFATGIEWGFALANIPRDVMHTWFAARQFTDGRWEGVYNANFPIFALQLGADIKNVFHDAAWRTGRYNDYIEQGGGMEFLTMQSRLFQRGKHLDSNVAKLQDLLGYFGTTSEILTRLAIRERVIKNRASERGISVEEARKDTKIAREATFAARDYLDFGQGGGMSKAMDNFIPYLNASIQGTRTLFRTFDPRNGNDKGALVSGYKLSQLGLLIAGTTIYHYKRNPETMEALRGSNAAMNNLCLPLGDDFAFEDENGQKRYLYVKIPMDPGQKFFKTFFEAATMKAMGKEIDVDRVVGSLKQVSPVQGTELPPILSGILGYITNKDFWLNEDIWKKTDKPFPYPQSKEEYVPGQTPDMYIELGKKTGVSPDRAKYAIEQLITSNSMWAYMGGKGYDELMGKASKEQKQEHLAITLSRIPGINRFLGVTNPYSRFAGPIEDASNEVAVRTWVENRDLDSKTKAYMAGKMKYSEVTDYIRTNPATGQPRDPDTARRLLDRFVVDVKTADMPNHSFWMRMAGLPAEVKAKVFVQEYDKADAKRQAELKTEVGRVLSIGGILSDRFWTEVSKIRASTSR